MVPNRLPRQITGALVAALLLLPVPTVAGPESLDGVARLRLASLADAMYDGQPSWTVEAERLPELSMLVEHIAAYIDEEGYGSGDVPSEVSMQADFGAQRSLQSGRYYPATDVVELNERFLTDPAWTDRPWLGVLVHEMVHAQGYPVEAQVQLITMEILATMANDGYPGALLELTDRLRRQAILSAWWLAAYEHDALPTRLATTNPFPYCRMGCTPISGDTSSVSETRQAIYDPAELRRALARERFWLKRSQRDYDVVLGSYVAEPLGVLLETACGDGLESKLTRDDSSPPIFPSVDDMRAFLKELAWC